MAHYGDLNENWRCAVTIDSYLNLYIDPKRVQNRLIFCESTNYGLDGPRVRKQWKERERQSVTWSIIPEGRWKGRGRGGLMHEKNIPSVYSNVNHTHGWNADNFFVGLFTVWGHSCNFSLLACCTNKILYFFCSVIRSLISEL